MFNRAFYKVSVTVTFILTINGRNPGLPFWKIVKLAYLNLRTYTFYFLKKDG